MWAENIEMSLLCLRKKSPGCETYRLVAFDECCDGPLCQSGLEAISGLHINVSLYTLPRGLQKGWPTWLWPSRGCGEDGS